MLEFFFFFKEKSFRFSDTMTCGVVEVSKTQLEDDREEFVSYMHTLMLHLTGSFQCILGLCNTAKSIDLKPSK